MCSRQQRILDFRFWIEARCVDEQVFKQRTQDAALRSIKLVEALPRNRTADILGEQLIRSGTSVGANYRAACRAKSAAGMAAKLAIVEEECDESIYWIELTAAAELIARKRLDPLAKELREIAAITVASIRTLRSRPIRNPRSKIQNA